MTVLDCSDPEARQEHLEDAAAVLRSGGLVVMPTDTVYGIAADAFDPDSVAALLAAKGRGRSSPPPVLVSGPELLEALAQDVAPQARALVERFWPGPLTLVVAARRGLTWDLGITQGTVALRMPDDEVALELLRLTGPLAVSSANRTGVAAATTVAEARAQLGHRVARYLDAGPSRGGESSTIVDATGDEPRILRYGALSSRVLGEVVPALLPGGQAQDPGGGPESDASPAP